MNTMLPFSSETYTQRRKALLDSIPQGIILIRANVDSPMNYAANVYSFRQNSHFLYYCGNDVAGLNLVMDTESGECILFGDELSMEDIVWTGPLPTLDFLATASGIQSVKPAARLRDVIEKAQTSNRNIHYTLPYRGESFISLSQLLGKSLEETKQGISSELVKAIIAQREIKTEEEIVEIHDAVNLTRNMHLAVMHTAKPGMIESEVFSKLMSVLHAQDCLPSFTPIMSINGQILHIHSHRNRMEEGKLLLVDAGAENQTHYAGDMTRTFPVGKTFSPRQKDVYEIVLAAQEAAIQMLGPNVYYKDAHLKSATVIAEGLKNLGLLKGKAEDIVAAGAHALFFPHGLGHMMGLDVHDMEDLGENNVGYDAEVKRSEQFGLAYLRLAKKLKPGFVLTVEPGIYFIPELWSMWKAENRHSDFINYASVESFLDFGGIRIEEDFVIRPSGAELLGKSLPKTIKAVEEERKKAFS